MYQTDVLKLSEAIILHVFMCIHMYFIYYIPELGQTCISKIKTILIFLVHFDGMRQMGKLSDNLMQTPYTVLSKCSHNVRKYPAILDANKQKVDKKKVFCAIEKHHKSKKVDGFKTKLCYVSTILSVRYT